jgi:hypothetical protein
LSRVLVLAVAVSVVCNFDGLREVRDIFDVSLWDNEYLGYVDEYADMEPDQRPRGIFPNGKQVFPHDARAKVYRFFLERIRNLSRDTRVALCGETPEIWEELGSELGMEPADYVCACGSTSTPGNPSLPNRSNHDEKI